MNKEYSHDGHTIYHGEAVEVLKSIKTSSVDLVFADPPYNIGKDFDGIHDRVEESEYFAWCWQWIDECHRVLKPDGTLYVS